MKEKRDSAESGEIKDLNFYTTARKLIGRENVQKLLDAGLIIISKRIFLSYVEACDPEFYRVITGNSKS